MAKKRKMIFTENYTREQFLPALESIMQDLDMHAHEIETHSFELFEGTILYQITVWAR